MPRKKFLDKLKDSHKVATIIAGCFIAGWVAYQYIIVKPLNSDIKKFETEINNQKKQLSELTKKNKELLNIIDQYEKENGRAVLLSKNTTTSTNILGESISLFLEDSSKTTNSAIIAATGSNKKINLKINNGETRIELGKRVYKIILQEVMENKVRVWVELLEHP